MRHAAPKYFWRERKCTTRNRPTWQGWWKKLTTSAFLPRFNRNTVRILPFSPQAASQGSHKASRLNMTAPPESFTALRMAVKRSCFLMAPAMGTRESWTWKICSIRPYQRKCPKTSFNDSEIIYRNPLICWKDC